MDHFLYGLSDEMKQAYREQLFAVSHDQLTSVSHKWVCVSRLPVLGGGRETQKGEGFLLTTKKTTKRSDVPSSLQVPWHREEHTQPGYTRTREPQNCQRPIVDRKIMSFTYFWVSVRNQRLLKTKPLNQIQFEWSQGLLVLFSLLFQKS